MTHVAHLPARDLLGRRVGDQHVTPPLGAMGASHQGFAVRLDGCPA